MNPSQDKIESIEAYISQFPLDIQLILKNLEKS